LQRRNQHQATAAATTPTQRAMCVQRSSLALCSATAAMHHGSCCFNRKFPTVPSLGIRDQLLSGFAPILLVTAGSRGWQTGG
jgi:hypothetical protein